MNRLLAFLAVLAMVSAARADDEEAVRDFLEPPPAYAVGRSHATVIGRVVEIEKDTVEMKSEWDPSEKVAHRVAVVEVDTGIEGAKAKERLKVAFPAKPPELTGRIADVDRPLPVELKEGQKALFYLARKPGANDYYVAPAGTPPVDAASKRYERKVGDARAAVTAIADPKKALNAPAERDRLAAAAAIVARLRWRDGKAVPADVTRLVVKAVLAVEWNETGAIKDRLPYAMSGPGLAEALGLRPGDNGVPAVTPKAGETYTDAWKKVVQEWAAKAGEKAEIRPIARPKE